MSNFPTCLASMHIFFSIMGRGCSCLVWLPDCSSEVRGLNFTWCCRPRQLWWIVVSDPVSIKTYPATENTTLPFRTWDANGQVLKCFLPQALKGMFVCPTSGALVKKGFYVLKWTKTYWENWVCAYQHGCSWGSRHMDFSVTAVRNRWIKKDLEKAVLYYSIKSSQYCILGYPRWPDNVSSHLRFVTYIFTCCESMSLQYCKGILDRKPADNKLITVSTRVAWDNLWTFSNS